MLHVVAMATGVYCDACVPMDSVAKFCIFLFTLFCFVHSLPVEIAMSCYLYDKIKTNECVTSRHEVVGQLGLLKLVENCCQGQSSCFGVGGDMQG